MMSRTPSRTPLLAAALLAGCFGAGPEPPPATDADIVFALPPQDTDCGLHPYIGDVAIGTSVGYAVVGQYLPGASCNSGGAGNTLQTTISRFPSPTTKVGDLTVGFNQAARITMPPTTGFSVAVWASGSTNSQVAIDSTDSARAFAFAPASQDGFVPVGLISDADQMFVALASPTGQAEFATPTYPCCGGSFNQNVMGSIYRIVGTTASRLLQAPLQCLYTEHCLAQNTDSLFFLTSEQTDTAVHMIAKSGAGGEVSLGSASQGVAIAGVAANDAYAVWIFTGPFDQQPLPQCEINIYNLATQQTATFLSTAFECAEVRVDSDYAWFTIVHVPTSGGQAADMVGRGIARVKLSDPTVFESIDLGIVGRSAGARRAIPAGDDIYAVDPFAIAKIAKSAFTDKHDFAP